MEPQALSPILSMATRVRITELLNSSLKQPAKATCDDDSDEEWLPVKKIRMSRKRNHV